MAPRKVLGSFRETLDLGATRYRDFQRNGREGLEQVTPRTENPTTKER